MAEGKKSFVLYADYIHTFELLTDEQAGIVTKFILRYVNDENPEMPEDLILKLALTPIIRQLKRDLKDWENEKIERSHSAVVGNIARWHPDIYAQIKQNQLSIPDALDKIKSLNPTAHKGIRPHPTASDSDPTASDTIANIAVNVNVNDNVTVNDNVNTIIPSELGEKNQDLVVGVVKGKRKDKKQAPRKKSNQDSEPYWKAIRFKWVWFNKTHLKFNVEPIPDRDYSHMHRIIEKLRERAIAQDVEWTEKNALERWEKFLTIAYTKDDWLPNNFLLGNLESKMQKVFKLIENPNGQQGTRKSTTGSVGKTIEFDRP